MTDEEFIQHLLAVIEIQGYVNLTKKIKEHFPQSPTGPNIIFLLRKFTYTLVGTGDYSYEDVSDGRLLYKREEYYINRRVEKTSQSVVDTNTATQKLYNETLPKNFEDQRKFGNKSLFIGLLSVAFIGLTFWKECRDTTQSKLQDLSLKSDSLRIELQNIRSSVESVNHSIQKVVTDTFVVKKKHP